ncbi:hypothetical protein SSX86_032286 [Deinandra increscens subsp. villosa]|uniref:UEV domain-containing protein n=1 Tax=Deinandra increscens subsp. villosa TaxID=3103831 RepID=A0AAP0GHG7_9ASTR
MVRPPPSSTAQFTRKFLSSVLSQRGPFSLPYSEDVKWLIRQHLFETYPSLHPKTAVFTHNDDRSINLLQFDGTVPMLYQNVTYNTLVVIWLMESYPRHPSLVFVSHTRDMIIKPQHAFVNPSGFVSIHYLQNCVYSSSNFVDLVRNLSHYSGRIPPPSPSPAAEDPSGVYRRNAIDKLVQNMHNDVRELRKKREIVEEGIYGREKMRF